MNGKWSSTSSLIIKKGSTTFCPKIIMALLLILYLKSNLLLIVKNDFKLTSLKQIISHCLCMFRIVIFIFDAVQNKDEINLIALI